MYKYEATFIMHPSAEQCEKGTVALKKEFEANGIKILKEESRGELDLSYPIKKNRKGRYYLFELEAPAPSVNAVEKTLKIKSEILKYLFIRVKA